MIDEYQGHLLDQRRQLIDALDDALDAAGLGQNRRASAVLAVALCDRLGNRLDGERQSAIEAARNFWAVGDGVEYKKWLDFFSTRLNDQPLSDPVDRLVWSALAQSGGLDSYTGEYLVLESLDAGLDVSAVSEAIKTVVPEYTYS